MHVRALVPPHMVGRVKQWSLRPIVDAPASVASRDGWDGLGEVEGWDGHEEAPWEGSEAEGGWGWSGLSGEGAAAAAGGGREEGRAVAFSGAASSGLQW